MTSRDFVYWLQGLFELAKPEQLNAEQTELIRRHLQLVFIHEIDPSFPQEQQDQLQTAHDPTAEETPKSLLDPQNTNKDPKELAKKLTRLVEAAKKRQVPMPPTVSLMNRRFMC